MGNPMATIGWRDTRELMFGGPSGRRPVAAALVIFTMLATAVAYSLPLNQTTDDAVSTYSFGALTLVVITVAAVRSRWTTGFYRLAWITLASSFTVIGVLVALNPNPVGDDLPIFLDIAILPAFGFWMAVLALASPALPGLASLRTAADAIWVGAATVIATWPWTIGPLVAIEGRSGLTAGAHILYGILSITLGSTVLVIIPFTAGRGRIALWAFGLGGATASLAGVFHMRFYYEGTLRFGSAWDYLWTVGIGLLAFAGLVTVENELTPRRRGVRWHVGLTVVPLLLAGIGLAANGSFTGQLTGALILLMALAARVIALLFENDRLTRSLTTQAQHDPLTGLANRRALVDGFARIGEVAQARDRQRALIILDLDRFKTVNDTHGHLVGDEVLKIVARRLREAVRDEDLLVRHGGDEFVATLLVRNRQEADRATDRIQRALQGHYELPVGPLTLGVTMGVALDNGRAALDDLLPIADQALYRAKELGRGSVEVTVVTPAVGGRSSKADVA